MRPRPPPGRGNLEEDPASCTVPRREFVANERIVDTWSLALEGTETYTVGAEGSGSRVTLQRRRRSFWRLRLLDTLADRFEGPESERFLVRLKQLMESSGAAAKAAG
ncbi:MAG TPA: hypothetical protein VFK66_07985 [Oryzihumus sp.]|nr:hypothetical protein [Oryzihumus sp.]